MDLLLLSRARRVGGSMLGNMPRLAMQLRVEPPSTARFISLDGHKWCTTSSCKPYNRAYENATARLQPRAPRTRRGTRGDREHGNLTRAQGRVHSRGSRRRVNAAR
eukprot:4628644-Prymnesium_polylepis.1